MILGLTGIIAGFFITFHYFVKWEPRLEKISDFITKYSKYAGILSLFVALWNFFGPDLKEIPPQYVGAASRIVSEPFIGDLFPVIFLFAAGLLLFSDIFQYILIKEDVKEKITGVLTNFRLLVGFGNIFLGFIHLFTPGSTLF